MRVVGSIAASFVGAFLLANGLVMLISPQAWFRLPKWLGLHGSLTRERYSSGNAQIVVRILGAVFVAAVVWVVHDLLLGR